MMGTALHTNEIFQYLVSDKNVIAFTTKYTLFILCYFNVVSVINMRICNVLLNFFVSVYVYGMGIRLHIFVSSHI